MWAIEYKEPVGPARSGKEFKRGDPMEIFYVLPLAVETFFSLEILLVKKACPAYQNAGNNGLET